MSEASEAIDQGIRELKAILEAKSKPKKRDCLVVAGKWYDGRSLLDTEGLRKALAAGWSVADHETSTNGCILVILEKEE